MRRFSAFQGEEALGPVKEKQMHEADCSEEAIHASYKARVLFPPPRSQVEMSQGSDGA